MTDEERRAEILTECINALGALQKRYEAEARPWVEIIASLRTFRPIVAGLNGNVVYPPSYWRD